MENLPPQNDDQNIPEEEPIPEDPEEDPKEEEDDEEDPEEDPEEGDDEEEEIEVDDEEDLEESNDEEEEMEVDDEENNLKVFPLGPRPSDLRAIHSRTTKLEKQMFERYTIEFKIRNNFKENDLHMNSQEIKASTNYSNMMRPQIPEGLRFREEPPIPSASVPHADDPYVMIRDAAIAAQEDDDDDADADKDSQPSESCGSLRDP
ncbi:hypothetical protein Tco_1231987 [Tanacetum coccineum]